MAEIITAPTFDEARLQANDESTNSASSVYPVILFRQGSRLNLSGAITIKQLPKHVSTVNRSKKGDSPVQVIENKNRPRMQDHIDVIANYLEENVVKGIWILPPVTLNVKQKIRVYTGPGSSTIKAGYLVLPDASTVEITDGQHRIVGTLQALSQMAQENAEAFSQDALAFMLTCEDNTRQVHQDFADCSKTKAIPPSLLTAYDTRQPANGLVIDLMNTCPVFRDKIDSTGKTIGKSSLKLFVTNQIRQMVKTMLTGDIALSEPQFVDRAKHLLPDDVECKKTLTKFAAYINLLTEHIDPWKEAATIFRGADLNKIKLIRERGSLALTATGLNIIGLIGYELFNKVKEDWRPFAEKLGKLDFQKSTELWKDVLAEKVNDKTGEKTWQILTQRGPVTRAVARVRQEIGLDPEPKRQANEDAGIASIQEEPQQVG
jgi:DNA sulfur modification protein DndB